MPDGWTVIHEPWLGILGLSEELTVLSQCQFRAGHVALYQDEGNEEGVQSEYRK